MSGNSAHTVLIVEDEWLVRMELADAFDALGFAVLESASAEHALEVLQASSEISLLITDIRLTGPGDGWQLAIQARQMRPELPVIYLSANPPVGHLIVAEGIFIEKPALMRTVTDIANDLLH